MSGFLDVSQELVLWSAGCSIVGFVQFQQHAKEELPTDSSKLSGYFSWPDMAIWPYKAPFKLGSLWMSPIVIYVNKSPQVGRVFNLRLEKSSWISWHPLEVECMQYEGVRVPASNLCHLFLFCSFLPRSKKPPKSRRAFRHGVFFKNELTDDFWVPTWRLTGASCAFSRNVNGTFLCKSTSPSVTITKHQMHRPGWQNSFLSDVITDQTWPVKNDAVTPMTNTTVVSSIVSPL